MPISFTIDAPGRVVVAVVTPPAPTADECAVFLDAVLAHPDHGPGAGILYDRRAVGAPDVEYTTSVAAAIRSRAGRLGRCRWAVVVPDFDTFAMVGHAVAHHAGSGVEGRAFADPAEALAWLRDDPNADTAEMLAMTD